MWLLLKCKKRGKGSHCLNSSVPIPTCGNWLGIDREFGRKFGSALFFVSNYSNYSLSESSAEVRPNRKFGLSLVFLCELCNIMFLVLLPPYKIICKTMQKK